jgi:hypothetical protein
LDAGGCKVLQSRATLLPELIGRSRRSIWGPAVVGIAKGRAKLAPPGPPAGTPREQLLSFLTLYLTTMSSRGAATSKPQTASSRVCPGTPAVLCRHADTTVPRAERCLEPLLQRLFATEMRGTWALLWRRFACGRSLVPPTCSLPNSRRGIGGGGGAGASWAVEGGSLFR